MTAEIDGAASAAFSEAFRVYAASLGSAFASAPRRAAIWLCQSLRKGTRKAGRTRPVAVRPLDAGSDTRPLWVTWERGSGRLAKPKRLVSMDFPERTSRSDVRVYAVGRDAAQWQGFADRGWGRLYEYRQRPTGTRGLAKRSWGWVMHNIYNGERGDAPWRRRANDRRNPMDATSESTSREQPGSTVASGFARICNRLDYIRSALDIPVGEAVGKTTSRMLGPVVKRRLRASGVSSGYIKEAAAAVIRDFKRAFAV